jgi:hypothetical protein
VRKEGKNTWEENPPSKNNASKEEKVTTRKLFSSLQDDPAKSETLSQ